MLVTRDLRRGRAGRGDDGSPGACAWHVRFARSATSCSTQDIRWNRKAGDRRNADRRSCV